MHWTEIMEKGTSRHAFSHKISRGIKYQWRIRYEAKLEDFIRTIQAELILQSVTYPDIANRTLVSVDQPIFEPLTVKTLEIVEYVGRGQLGHSIWLIWIFTGLEM